VKISTPSVFGAATRYLGVTIDDGTAAVDNEISPRQQFVTSSYAFRAKVAESVDANAISSAMLATDAVGSTQLAAASVTNAKLGTDAVLTTNIGNLNVTTAKLADASVTTAKLADSAVTTAKIADANVTTAKLATGSVNSTAILDGAITGTDIANTTIPLGALVSAVQQALCPPGTVVAYMGTTAPAGWLLCNGASVSRTTYASLYAVIGNASGSADTNSFNVPDFRGRFLRGWDNNTGRDPDRFSRTAMATGGNINDAIGSIQGDQLESHNHHIARTVVDWNADAGFDHRSLTATTDDGHWTGQNTEFTGGNETRPINAYVNYIIKF